MTQQALPAIAITTGEPAGIGPDICLKLACHSLPASLVFIGCPVLLAQRAQQLNLNINIKKFDPNKPLSTHKKGSMTVFAHSTDTTVYPGVLDERNSRYVLDLLQKAVDGYNAGIFAGIVTAPVHKGIINKAGIPFSGHTEWFAEATHTHKVVMMLACEGLRVALATTHLPLSQVPSAITEDRIKEVLTILHTQLQKKFAIADPHIFICGLNPHAGENGYLGREEIDTIIPAIQKCRDQGMKLTGPLPADTLFSPTNLKAADAVLAMYHDQGLPVLKFKGFGEAVNITLGLPFVRVSVDHGTALDLAGTGMARENSLRQTVNYLLKMLKVPL